MRLVFAYLTCAMDTDNPDSNLPPEENPAPPASGPETEGGAGRNFPSTRWSTVLAAGVDSSPQAESALDRLCRAYWYPLYAYVRRGGRNADQAADLTQGFFEHFLERKAFLRADQARGRFRTYLLTCLKHFLINQAGREQARKRGGDCQTFSLDDDTAEERYRLEPATDLTPDRLYDRRWAIAVLEQARLRLRDDMAAAGKGRQFELLQPFLQEQAIDGAYAQVAGELGLTPNAVGVLVHRFRRQYVEAIRDQVAETVTTAVELDEEMRHLMACLSLH